MYPRRYGSDRIFDIEKRALEPEPCGKMPANGLHARTFRCVKVLDGAAAPRVSLGFASRVANHHFQK